MLRFILLVIIGGLIGWATNKIAIKMLFRPINPHKILGVTFQGVFPRRKDQIAISLSKIIEEDLLSKDVIMDQLFGSEKLDAFKDKLKIVLVDKLVDAIPPMAAMLLGGNIRTYVTKYIDKHSDELFEQMLNEFRSVGLENLNIYELVKQRLDALDFYEFEKIIFGLMNKELRFVEVIGLVIGGCIGVIQYFLTLLI
ncbi:MAG: DUF445 family protein [Tenericutes bacterium]|nr:DUF445 family protein [Mycoplasmatota bacterium]